MAKFSVKMKVTGFELEIVGERSDASLIGQRVAEQFSGMIQPSVEIINGRDGRTASLQPSPQIEALGRRKPRKKRSSSGESSGDSSGSEAIDYRHDSAKFGMLQQAWNTATKAIWLLYVLRESGTTIDLTAKQISETFNTHFKQSGMIKSFNVTRDLGKAKAQERPTPLGENATIDPSTWFLTDEGTRRAQSLVASALGTPSDGTG